MTRQNRQPWLRFSLAIWLLLTLSSASFWSCKPEPELVPIGPVRVVGQINKGIVTYGEGEDPKGDYNIVTPAFVLKLIDLAFEVKRLELEIERLKELIKKRENRI
jgi:hypothetical protein